MGEPLGENHRESGVDGSQSSASSDHNGSCNGTMNGNPSSNASAHLNVNKPAPDLDYLTQLLKDKKQLAAFPNVFGHVERLLDDEINRVRVTIFQCEFTREPLQLPEPAGEIITKQEKVFVPVKAYPEYNFVGRILGPRGMTAKQLEAETGCKIMVRGKGSMRDKKKEDMNRGKPNWEHLSEELHVLIQCEDTPNRVEVKIARAVEEVKKLLVPSPEGEDDLKKKQLMELAIINGTYRNSAAQNTNAVNQQAALAAALNGSKAGFLQLDQRLLTPTLSMPSVTSIRSPGLAGAPLIMQPTSAHMVSTPRSASGVTTSTANSANNTMAAAQAQAALALHLGALNGAHNGLAAQNGVFGNVPTSTMDYQQLLLNSMQYDPNVLAQFPGATAGGLLTDPYGAGGMDLAHAGSILSQQRRFLGQSRDHPYGSAKRDGN
ncbi:homodimerization region of STAR domain protein [Ditylenchus destructor]|nr:homodimerization region of STAR domain protein [Ditylenchus destructor]